MVLRVRSVGSVGRLFSSLHVDGWISRLVTSTRPSSRILIGTGAVYVEPRERQGTVGPLDVPGGAGARLAIGLCVL